MTDATTKAPLRVIPAEGTGPYLRLPLSQLADVRRLLDSHGIRYWPDPEAISMNGGPPIAYINFSRTVEAETVQDLLDRQP